MIELHLEFENDTVRKFYSERKNHTGDAGFDLYYKGDTEIYGNGTVLVGLGVKAAMYSNYDDDLYRQSESFFLFPRSSISKTPLRMANSVGIIDSGYRGELKVAIDNTHKSSYYITAGERHWQICHPSLQPFSVKFVDSLDETERGSGGFGSTNGGDL